MIPQIVSVVEARRPADARAILFPDACPVCGSAVLQEKKLIKQKTKTQEKLLATRYCSGGLNCLAQVKESLKHFVSRNAVDIEGVGDKLVEQLVDSGLVKHPADLFRLEVEDFIKLDGFAETSASNVFYSIKEKIGKTSSIDFLFGLGIPSVGQVAAEKLMVNFGCLDNIIYAPKEIISITDGIGDDISSEICNYFSNESVRTSVIELADVMRIEHSNIPVSDKFKRVFSIEKLLHKLSSDMQDVGATFAKAIARAIGIEGLKRGLSFGDLVGLTTDKGNRLTAKKIESVVNYFRDNQEKINALCQYIEEHALLHVSESHSDTVDNQDKNFIYGKSFVITGSFSFASRDVLTERLKSMGGENKSSVSKNTDFLIVGDKAGSKLKKATELGISIINEDSLQQLLELNNAP